MAEGLALLALASSGYVRLPARGMALHRLPVAGLATIERTLSPSEPCLRGQPAGGRAVVLLGVQSLQPEDVPYLVAAVLIAVGAVFLQARPIRDMLSKDGRQARAAGAVEKPEGPGWWPTWLRLPELEFVEVYGQEPQGTDKADALDGPAEEAASRGDESTVQRLNSLLDVHIDEPDHGPDEKSK